MLSSLLRAEMDHAAALARDDAPDVLVIYPDDRLLPSSHQFDAGLRSELSRRLKDNVDIYVEYLGLGRFADQNEEQIAADHLRQRYANRPPRVIVAAGPVGLEFVRKFRGSALPDVPVVVGGVRETSFHPMRGHAEYAVTMALATRPSVELMRQLQPGLTEVVVVSGASVIDSKIEDAARAELEPLADRVRFRYWSGLSLPDLLNRARQLTPGTGIFFLSFMADGRGRSFTSSDVVRQLSNHATVPVYGFSASYVGRGVVGGLFELYEEHGRVTGGIVADLLQGRPPVSAVVAGPPPVFEFDAGELLRWRIERDRLPMGSRIIQDAPESIDELQQRLIFALTAILLLTALVIILLVNRQRLHLAERGLHERLRFEQLASGISAALISTPPERMDQEIERALEKVRLAVQLDRCVLFDFQSNAQAKHITHRAEAPTCVPLDALMPRTRLPWFFRQLEEGRVVASADVRRELPVEAELERAYCAELRIRSVLVMPVRQAGQLTRWIGFYTDDRVQEWPAELSARLHVIGEILVSAVAGAHAEMALRQSEQLNRDILSSLTEQVALVDRQGTILSVNQAWHRFLRESGAGNTPVVGTNYLDACRRSAAAGDRDASRVVEGLERVLNGSRRYFDMVYSYAVPGLPAVRWFRLTVSPFNTPSGGAVVMHSDVSEQQRLHEALLQSEERYREVVESQTELVCRYRGDAVLTFVNEAYCRFFGRSRESLLGRSFLELIPAAGHPAVREQIAMLYRERQPHTYEHEVVLPDGTTRWQQWVDYPILDERGEIEEFQAIGRDITDRKRAEEANRNLTHAARLAVAGELTASIAHEINQPLGAILSNADAAEMLLERPNPPLDEIRQILVDIRSDDMRASDVIRHLRSLLRKHALELQPLDLNETITEVLRLASADGQRRRVHFAREFASDLPRVPGDRVHLQQVILNLLLNAMDAMAETPIPRRRVTLRTRLVATGGVEVAVIDTGHGLDPRQAEHVFDSFFTTKKEGMGLGLSIARSIIEAHHGTLVASNNPDGGATFAFTLPPVP
jgi:PAS domain S-box-containing protein